MCFATHPVDLCRNVNQKQHIFALGIGPATVARLFGSIAPGTDKLTNSATGRWEYRASFNLKTRSEWALESTYSAIISRSISASPRQRVNLSVSPRLLPVVVYIQGVYGFCARNMGRIRFLRPTTDRVVTQTTNPITVALLWMNLSRKPKRSSFA